MAKLTVVDGVLKLDGANCYEIGLNAYSLGEKTWGQATPDNVYVTDLPDIKRRGYNIIRLMAGPFDGTGTYGWGNVVGTSPPASWSDLNASYRAKIDAIMDTAAAAGLTVLPSCLWNYKAIPDMLSESYADAFKPSSASVAYWEAFAFVFADHFKNHDAYGAHIPFNEWPLESIRGFGAAPYIGWDVSMVRGVANRIWSAMRAADSTRCVIPGTISPPVYDLQNKWEWKTAIDDSIKAAGTCEVVDWHLYPITAYVGAEWQAQSDAALAYEKIVGLQELLSQVKLQAASRGKAFVCTEFGVGGNQDTNNTRRIQAITDAIKKSGVQMALAWDWNPRTSLIVSSQNQWSIYPNYEYNNFPRGNEYLKVLVNTNMRASINNAPRPKLPKKCARFAGVSGNHVVIPHAARYSSTDFTVMGWIRMIGRPAGFSIIADYRNSANSAGYVMLFDGDADGPYFDLRKSGPASAYNTADQYGRRRANRWYHYAVSFSNTQAQLFLDGREFRYFKFSSIGWAPPDGTANLRLGYNGTNGWARIDMADFALYDRRLDAQEVFDYVFYGARPASPAGWWPLQGNANDDSGFANNGTAGSALTFVPTVQARAARA